MFYRKQWLRKKPLPIWKRLPATTIPIVAFIILLIFKFIIGPIY